MNLNNRFPFKQLKAHFLNHCRYGAGQVFNALAFGWKRMWICDLLCRKHVGIQAEILTEPGQASPDNMAATGLNADLAYGCETVFLHPAGLQGLLIQNNYVGAFLLQLVFNNFRDLLL